MESFGSTQSEILVSIHNTNPNVQLYINCLSTNGTGNHKNKPSATIIIIMNATSTPNLPVVHTSWSCNYESVTVELTEER